MVMHLKDMIRLVTPPVFISIAKHLHCDWPIGSDALTGDYQNWNEAIAASTGYNTESILERTKKALLKVKNGEAVYERDSVLFNKIQYSWPLLVGLLWAAARSNGCLNILDFGGSLGSSYFQNRKFIYQFSDLRWNIVEQPDHVREGKKFFEDEHLRFYESIESCLSHTNPNVVVLSGVLQYLKQPYELLDKVLKMHCICVIIDRTPYWNGHYDRLCVQHVDPQIFDASYPMWIFSLQKFREKLNNALFEEFDSFENGLFGMMWKGFIISGGSNAAER